MPPPANLLSVGWRRYSHLLATNYINEQRKTRKVVKDFVLMHSFHLVVQAFSLCCIQLFGVN